MERTARGRALFVGIDEAGYGPNLGPLVVSSAAFLGPAELAGVDWWDELRPTLCRAADAPLRPPTDGSSPPLFVDDSKLVLARSRGAEHLAETVHSFAELVAGPAATLASLLRDHAPESLADLASEPWFPAVAASRCQGAEPGRADGLRTGLAAAGLEFVGFRARVLFPGCFGRELARAGNKAAIVLGCIRGLLRHWRRRVGTSGDPAAMDIACDRLGGRRYYAPELRELADDAWVAIHGETTQCGDYAFRMAGLPVAIRFAVGSDHDRLPVALASLLGKYLREECMRGFNRYWAEHVAGLRPTAGYPADARRFRVAVEPHLARLGIPVGTFWRER